jgi:hypothetical protein
MKGEPMQKTRLKKPKKKARKVVRSAGTGKFVKKSRAKTHPGITVTEELD